MSNKPGHREEHEVSRKTIARGMPGRSGVTVVTMLVCLFLFCMRGCGRIERPAFPAPSIVKSGETVLQTSGESRREIAEVYPQTTLLEKKNLRTRESALPLPLWERSDRIDRCDPGEGLRSIDRP